MIGTLPEARKAGVQLLSPQPAKRQAEIYFLLYTPLWIGFMAVLVLTRAFAGFGDVGYMALGLGLCLPLWLLPFIAPGPRGYLIKATVFIAILSFVQNGYGARLFFEGLGMRYRFPVRLLWNGTPLFLCPMTVAYFSTYFVILQVGWRLWRTALPGAGKLGHALGLIVLSYGVAFAETLFMASDALRDFFQYQDKARALYLGSLCYGTLFLISAPFFCAIDEDGETPLREVVWRALGVNVLILVAYDIYLATLLR